MKKAGRPAGTKSNKNWIAKGVRMSKDEWEKLDEIAKEMSVELAIELNSSSLVRKAVVEFIRRYGSEKCNRD